MSRAWDGTTVVTEYSVDELSKMLDIRGLAMQKDEDLRVMIIPKNRRLITVTWCGVTSDVYGDV